MNSLKNDEPIFAVCIDNRGYPASLELHKIYRVIPDEDASREGEIRVVDESGEDYLYSAANFVLMTIGVPWNPKARRSLLINWRSAEKCRSFFLSGKTMNVGGRMDACVMYLMRVSGSSVRPVEKRLSSPVPTR